MPGLDSFCGIYCGACLCNIVKDEGSLEETANKMNKTPEQLCCTDCKTAMHQDCSFVVCCTAKGISNCSECPEMPCEEMINFAGDGLKHHAVIIENLLHIRQMGLEGWLKAQKQKHTCAGCGARLSWNYASCGKCGSVL